MFATISVSSKFAGDLALGRIGVRQYTHLAILTILLGIAAFFVVQKTIITQAAPGINKTINFQGKMTDDNGLNVADGNYQFVFRMYTVASAGSATWTETVNLDVTDGIFHHQLGSSTALPGSVDFDTDNIFLGITFNSDPDGEMTPRIQLTATPYAFNSDQLDGLDASDFVQLSPSVAQSGNIDITGTVAGGTYNGQTISSAASFTGTIALATLGTNNTDTSLCRNSSNQIATCAHTSILQNGNSFGGAMTIGTNDAYALALETGGAARLIIDGTTGESTFTGNVVAGNGSGWGYALTGTTGSGFSAWGRANTATSVIGSSVTGDTNWRYLVGADGAMAWGPGNAVADILLTRGAAGRLDLAASLSVTGQVTVGTSDTTGTLLVLDTKTNSGDPTGVNGGMYYNSNSSKFRCYESGAWANCIGAGGGSGDILNGGQNGAIVIGSNDSNSLSLETNNTNRLVVSSAGAATFSTGTNSTTAFRVLNNSSVAVLTVDTTNSSVISGGNFIANGFLRLTGTGADTFTTPVGSGVGSKINVPAYSLSAFEQVLAFGATSGSASSSRVLSLFDARTGDHQPTFAVFNPNETNVIGFSWDGSNTNAKLKTLGVSSGASPGITVVSGDVVSSGSTTSGAVTVTSGSSNYLSGTTGDLYLGTGANTGSGATGNIILNTGAGGATAGSVIVRNGTNKTTAFVVQNTSSSAVFAVDTTNSRVNVGVSDTTGSLLVLDTKTGSGDPTGVNGGMYYNSNSSKFRCYEGGAWANCIGAGGGSGDILNGGQNGAIAIGTNDSNILSFKTNNIGRWSISEAGHLLPSADNTYDIGSSTSRVRDLYLGSSSLHIGEDGNEAVISYNTTSNSLQINQNLTMTADSYLNFGTVSGSGGYGIRDNNGVVEVKNQGSPSWLPLYTYTPATALLEDDFNDNSIDVAKWDTDSDIGGTVDESTQQLKLTVPSTGNASAQVYSQSSYNLTDKQFSMQLVNKTNPSYNHFFAMGIGDTSGSNDYAYWEIRDNNIYAWWTDGSNYYSQFSATYSNVTFQYLRMRESAGNLYWESSLDGAVWITRATLATPFSFAAAEVYVELGNWNGSVPGSSTATIDNVFVGGGESFVGIGGGGGALDSIVLNGNTEGSAVSLGTTDAYGVNFLANGATVSSLSSTGQALFKNSSNSTSAFQVQNAGGVTMFNIDSTNNRIAIGTSDTTGTLLVLDTKTDAGDPTGVNGGTYYNSSAGKFRCYEGSAWKDCIGSGGGSGDILNGGQNGAIIIGSNNANTLAFETNNTTRFTLSASTSTLTGTGATTIAGGSTLSLTSDTSNTLSIDSGSTGTIDIGTGTGVKSINLGTGGTGAKTVTVGSTASTGTTTIQSGSGGIVIGGGSTTAAVSLGAGTGIQTVSLGTGGTGAKTVTVGSTASTGVTTIQSGSGGILIGGGSTTAAVNLGTGTGIQTISLGTGGTGAKTVTVGSTASTGTTTLQAGSGGLLLRPAGSNVLVGTSDTTGTLLVLDTKTGAGDPTGVNGGTYYNSNTSKFRCYEGGTWKDCIGSGGGGSLFTDSGAATYLTSTTDNLSVGYAGDLNAKLAVVNHTNQAAFGIIAHSTQTAPLISTYTSGGSELFRLHANNNTSLFLGYQAGISDNNSDNNIGIGSHSLNSNATGEDNIALGYQALYTNTASDNIALGSYSLHSNTSGEHNIAIGTRTLADIETGDFNIGIGEEAGQFMQAGNASNTLLGYQSFFTTNGDGNTAVGAHIADGTGFTSASYNTIVGTGSASGLAGDGNIILGVNSGAGIGTGDGNIIIGNNLSTGSGVSDQLLIGGIMEGNLSTLDMSFNGKVGIGTNTPGSYLLNVQGGESMFGGNVIVGGPVTALNDDFSSTTLDAAWTFTDTAGGTPASYSLTTVPGNLRINVPSGTQRDCYGATTTCTRMMRTFTDEQSATFETMISGSTLNTKYQSYGMIFWQDSNNYIRAEFTYDGFKVDVNFLPVIGGTAMHQTVPVVTMGSNNGIRVVRDGTNWLVQYSTNNGASWTTAGTYSVSLTVNNVGMQAGTADANPGVQGNFDYFNIYYQDGTSMLGIGTDTPDEALDVVGNIQASGNLKINGTGVSSIMGSLGIGTTNVQGALTIENDTWITALNSSGTGHINIFKVNANDEIELGAALAMDGNIILPTDAGQITLVDLPIASATGGAAQSYSFRVGSSNVLTVYGESNGSGGVQNTRVSIGTSIAPAYKLHVQDSATNNVARFNGTGSTQCTVVAGTGWSCSSDERLKTNVSNISTESALYKIGQLQGVTYNWTTDPSGDRQNGFIAQAIQQVFPELVMNDGNGYLSLNKDGLLPYMVGAIQEQQKQITIQQNATQNVQQYAQRLNTVEQILANGTLTRLTVTGPTTLASLTVTGDTEVANILVNGKIVSKGNIPTVKALTAAGELAEVKIDGTDTAGTLTFKVLGGQEEVLMSGEVLGVTFTSKFDVTPRVVLTPANSAAAKMPIFTTKTPEGFILHLPDVAVEDTEYSFDYIVIGSGN